MTATHADREAPEAPPAAVQDDAADAGCLEQTALDAVQQGNLALAELAFLKLSTAQPSAMTFANLYDVAAARANYDLAKSALEALVAIEPNNARALEQLAELRGLTGDSAGAAEALRRALLIEPDNAALAARRAIWTQDVPEHCHEAPDLLIKAATLDEDGSELEAIVEALIRQQRYEDAEHYVGVFQEKTGGVNPHLMRCLGLALAGQDRPEEAREVFEVAIESCNGALDDKAPGPEGWRNMTDTEFRRVCELYAYRARLEHEAGLTASAAGTCAVLGDAARIRGLSYPESPVPDTAARLDHLRDIVAGRDLVLLSQGPELRDFATRIDDVGTRRPAFAALDRFGAIEHDVLAPAKRGLDIVVETMPGAIRHDRPQLKKFLQQPCKTMAILSDQAFAGAFLPEDLEAFFAVNGRRLLIVPTNGMRSVTPYDPLGVIADTPLLAAVPLVVAARPKRVFIIGGAHRPNGVPDPQTRANRDLMLRNDAALCDRDVAFQIGAVAALHGFDAPAVFNVAIESRLQSLPGITLDAFFDMVS